MEKKTLFLLIFLLLIVELKAQLGFIGGKTKDSIKVDTLCYPFEGEEQLIVVDWKNYVGAMNQQTIAYANQHSALPHILTLPDNVYLFRNRAGKITKRFHTNQSLKTLTTSYQHIKEGSTSNSSTKSRLGSRQSYYVVAKVPVIYDEKNSHSSSNPIRQVQKNVGLIDSKGKLVLPYLYQDLIPIKAYFFAYRSGKLGVVRAVNETVVPIEYDYYLPVKKDVYSFWTNRKCQGFFYANTGRFISIKEYDHIYNINGLLKGEVVKVKKDGKYGLINAAFEEVVPLVYEELDYFLNAYYRVKKNGLYGLITASGELLIAPEYLEIANIKRYDKIRVRYQGGKYGFLDDKGDVVIEGGYEQASDFCYPGVAIVYQQGKATLIDSMGVSLLEHPYHYIGEILGGNFMVNNGAGTTGVIDATGKIIIPCHYQKIELGGLDINAPNQKRYYIAVLANEEHYYSMTGELMEEK